MTDPFTLFALCARRMAGVEESKKAAGESLPTTFFLIADQKTCGPYHPAENPTDQLGFVSLVGRVVSFRFINRQGNFLHFLQSLLMSFTRLMTMKWRFLVGNLPTYGDFHGARHGS